MKNLDQVIRGKGEVRGFVFTQIQKSHKAYIYQVDSGASIYYQVFKVTHKTNSKRHCFPTSKAFGVWAWAYISLDKANEKFNELNKVE
jgi:hypothetical protein